MSIAGLYFLVLAPIVGPILGIIVGGIISAINSSDSTTSPTSCEPRSRKTSYSSSYYEPPMRDWESERILSSMETEMRAHNARVEQMMMEQHRTMIENESRRISESINRPLSEQFDTRHTNIFRNPWDGIL